jgi:hypothetical protein
MVRTQAQKCGGCFRNLGSGITDGILEPAGEIGKGNAYGGADFPQLNHVKLALARLVLAYE